MDPHVLEPADPLLEALLSESAPDLCVVALFGVVRLEYHEPQRIVQRRILVEKPTQKLLADFIVASKKNARFHAHL